MQGDLYALHEEKLTPSIKPRPPSGLTRGGQYTATKVAANRKRKTGTTNKAAGAGAVVGEKCHQNEGFLVEIMFNCTE